MFKILITDDDLDLRELLTEAVSNWGYEVSVAEDGAEALKKLRMERFDIVISDLMMPGMDGIELLGRIKELDKDILVIMVTGYATIETAVKAIEMGAYDYIAKPFRLDELMVVLRNACERLKLLSQNKNLLDELRSAYAEIDSLKAALEGCGREDAGGGEQGGGREDTDGGERGGEKGASVTEEGGEDGLARREPGTKGQQGYLREADRIIFNAKR